MSSRTSFFTKATPTSFTMSSGGSMLNRLKMPQINSSRFILYIIAIIILGIIGYFAYGYLTKKFKVGYKENKEHMSKENQQNGSSKECEILLFSTSWCPHCKSAKPIWEEVKTEYNGKIVNGYSIIFTEVDCTNETPDTEKMMNRYKIEGFPTIKLLKNGQVIEFDAKVSKENLINFINTAI